MAHAHSIYDTDPHFSINPKTRTILDESGTKTVLVQGDHNSERCTFELPRTIDGHDMSLCNVVRVHYNNIDASTKAVNKGTYMVNDLQLSPDDDQVVICSWLISRNATQYVGALGFLLEFSCVVDGVSEYAWHTAVYSGLNVSTGIDNGEAITEAYPDILEQWRRELFSHTAGELAKIEAKGQQMRDAIPESYAALEARLDLKSNAYRQRASAGSLFYAEQGSLLNATLIGYTGEGLSGTEQVTVTQLDKNGTTVATYYLEHFAGPLYGDNVDRDVVNTWEASSCDRRLYLDGSDDEGWVYEGLKNSFHVFRLDGCASDYAGTVAPYSNWLPYGAYWSVSKDSIDVKDGALLLSLAPGRLGSNDLTGLRAYLAGQPLVVFYRSSAYEAEAGLMVVRVDKRWGLIESYAGETIPGKYVSSTGGLDAGARVLYKLKSSEVYMQDPVRIKALGSGESLQFSTPVGNVLYSLDHKCYIDNEIADLKRYIDNKLDDLERYIDDELADLTGE